jgi:small nuclear ribonucleoprotein D3
MSLMNVGAPIQLLFEGEGHIVVVELKNGETYRGLLVKAEETMNCQLKEVTMTAKEGRVSRLEHVFLRGGTIKFIQLPEILKNAPIFQKVNQMRQSKSKDSSRGASDKGGKGPDAGRSGGGPSKRPRV